MNRVEYQIKHQNLLSAMMFGDISREEGREAITKLYEERSRYIMRQVVRALEKAKKDVS